MDTKGKVPRAYRLRIARGLSILTSTPASEIHQKRLRQAYQLFQDEVNLGSSFDAALHAIFCKFSKSNEEKYKKMVEESNRNTLGCMLGDLCYRANTTTY